MRLRCVVLLAALAGICETARADVYRYVDKDGVVHITNIRPKRKNSRKWKKVLKESNKVSARRGACDRCDVVPAKDHSRERYRRYDAFIEEASGLYQIPIPLIRAVIKTESDYDPRVVSSAGARGLMQLMPAVVEDMGVLDVHDPRQNILGGTRLLRILANRYDGDVVRTIAAYHAGPGALAKYGDNVPPYKRTRRYTKTVLSRYYKYQSDPAAFARN